MADRQYFCLVPTNYKDSDYPFVEGIQAGYDTVTPPTNIRPKEVIAVEGNNVGSVTGYNDIIYNG